MCQTRKALPQLRVFEGVCAFSTGMASAASLGLDSPSVCHNNFKICRKWIETIETIETDRKSRNR